MSSTLQCINNSVKQSSANKQSGELMPLIMSFMYNKSINGPSTVPGGTPDKIGTELEDSLSSTTHWERCQKLLRNLIG